MGSHNAAACYFTIVLKQLWMVKATDYHLSGGMHSQLVNSSPNSELVNPEKQSSCYSRLYNPSPNSGLVNPE